MRRIKHACADSGISLEAVDGEMAERIWFDRIRIIRAFSPFFIRLDKRGRVKPEEPDISRIRKVLMENITGTKNGPRGSYFLGIPERAIEDIVLKNIKLGQKASLKPVIQPSDIPLMYGAYPDAHMIAHIGDAPAFALWARNVKRLTLINYEVICGAEEKRPEYADIV